VFMSTAIFPKAELSIMVGIKAIKLAVNRNLLIG